MKQCLTKPSEGSVSGPSLARFNWCCFCLLVILFIGTIFKLCKLPKDKQPQKTLKYLIISYFIIALSVIIHTIFLFPLNTKGIIDCRNYISIFLPSTCYQILIYVWFIKLDVSFKDSAIAMTSFTRKIAMYCKLKHICLITSINKT